MEKTIDEMELEDWDFVSDVGLLDVHGVEDGGKGVLVPNFNPKGLLDMDYFSYQSPDSHLIADLSKNPSVSNDVKTFSPIRIRFDAEEMVKEVVKVPILEKIEYPKLEEDSQQQQQLSLEKENKFVDMKVDSSPTEETVEFEDKRVDYLEKKDVVVQEKKDKCCEKEEMKVWKWKISGGAAGALCSIGMAAATICIFIIGSQQKHKHLPHSHKLQFQIYTDDKRFKNVIHHATKLNQAILSVSGVPCNRAHFTYGGYYSYDGL